MERATRPRVSSEEKTSAEALLATTSIPTLSEGSASCAQLGTGGTCRTAAVAAAELQFAFICFLIGNVYDAFEHWKGLLNILCRSEDAIGKYQGLYTDLIFVLYHQLSEIPSDFFVDIVSQDNFLTSTLQVFFSYTCNAADRVLRKKAEKFKAHLTKKFKWDFDAEPDDCAPVVVELPEGMLVD